MSSFRSPIRIDSNLATDVYFCAESLFRVLDQCICICYVPADGSSRLRRSAGFTWKSSIFRNCVRYRLPGCNCVCENQPLGQDVCRPKVQDPSASDHRLGLGVGRAAMALKPAVLDDHRFGVGLKVVIYWMAFRDDGVLLKDGKNLLNGLGKVVLKAEGVLKVLCWKDFLSF
ncbi:uncharacterized protein LOC143216920 [Lasioglossum baleicum]|uniref:uncharacterized protein LOC143216920 n=1 Tax=Lasioglossum baleicum TaxID=434251 RepID=UPI003FCCDD39